MAKTRREAFSDGVIAIIITIMVLGLRPPDTPIQPASTTSQWDFFAYVLSFVFIGIYLNASSDRDGGTRCALTRGQCVKP